MAAIDYIRSAGLSLLGLALTPVPTSEKKRQRVMQAYRDSLEYYRPLVEERLGGVKTDDIEVRDLSYLNTDIFYDSLAKELEKDSRGGTLTQVDIDATVSTWNLGHAITGPLRWLRNGLRIRTSYYKAGNNTLYVSFAPLVRIHDFNLDERFSSVDKDCVYAISYSAWSALGGKSDLVDNIMRKNFADYCADEYMSHLYPEGTSNGRELPDVFPFKNRVRMIVENHGGNVVREIPANWLSLSEGIQG